MHRRMFEADWERKKEYLVRRIFENPLVLSPICESPESRFLSQESQEAVRRSPLPELIVERQKRYYDESEEFYDKLEVKMKKLYRKLFLNEEIDDDCGFDEIEITCDEPIPDYRDNNEEANAGRDLDDQNDTNDITNKSHIEDDRESIDNNILEKLRGSISQSTSLTSIEFAEESELSEEPLAETEGKEDSEISVYDNNSNLENESDHKESQELSNHSSEDKDSQTYSETRDDGGTVKIIVTQAVIEHANEDEDSSSSVADVEIMRRQKSQSLQDSLQLDIEMCKSPTDVEDLNTARLSMEHDSNESTIYSVPMDLGLEEFQGLLRISTPSLEPSPILCGKRKQMSEDPNDGVPSKKKKQDDSTESHVNILVGKPYERVFMTDACTETSKSNQNAPIQAETRQEHCDYRHADTQTNPIEESEILVDEEPVDHVEAETQTDSTETRDGYAQTNNYNFEFWRDFVGFRFYFFF